MILFHRKYKSGTGFCIWRWTDIYDDSEHDDLYLRRLHIIQVPHVGAIMLHWIVRPDHSRDLHDHPVSFLSFVLRGGYLERVPSSIRGTEFIRIVRWWNFKRATDAHRITDVWGRGGALTLVFAGPKRRQWGFHTANGWVPWTEYERLDI